MLEMREKQLGLGRKDVNESSRVELLSLAHYVSILMCEAS